MLKTKEKPDLLEMRFEIWWAAKYRDISKHQTMEYHIAKEAWKEGWKEAIRTKEAGGINKESYNDTI